MTVRVRCTCCVLAAFLTVAAKHAMAQDSLASVRELYASASYEDVLSMLARLENTPPSVPRVELERYRVFSLIALGRATEASQIENLKAQDAAINRVLFLMLYDDRRLSGLCDALRERFLGEPIEWQRMARAPHRQERPRNVWHRSRDDGLPDA